MVLTDFEKAKKKIRVGHRYYIVGHYGGCHLTKCYQCQDFAKPSYITVTDIEETSDERCIKGKSSTNHNEQCHFDPRDLVPVGPNWKRRLD